MKSINTKWLPITLVGLTSLLLFSAKGQAEVSRNRLLKLQQISKQGKPPVLFDINRQSQIFPELKKVAPRRYDPQLTPNRIYLVWDEIYKRWVYALTDFEGYLPNPLEGFRTLSVVPGEVLGDKTPGQRYQLKPEGIWLQTFRPREYYLWVYSTPPKVKIVSFMPLQKPSSTEEKGKE